MTLILASKSKIRRAMLTQAGVAFDVRPPDFDENPLKQGHSGSTEQLAVSLAEGKAKSIAANDDDWVIGSDSIVEVGGIRFSKPADRGGAADHLRFFSGKTMILSSAVALARRGAIDWSCGQSARLDVRPLSETFIEQYLDREWPAVSYCAGVFRMEELGVTLFDHIFGDYFSILGMPLLPLLGALRERGLVTS
jgi:septum formation protein